MPVAILNLSLLSRVGSIDCLRKAMSVAEDLLPDNVKFAFVSTSPKWIHHVRHIDVNTSLQVRVNGGTWHGEARYGQSEEQNVGELLFHYNADLSKMRRTRFYQIPGTLTYLSTPGDPAYNAMLITKVD